MKITKIKLHNLASIEGTAEIDFEKEPLKSAGIFAISGPTGSGKSTILDALCLGLYDKTPRFQSTTETAKIPDTNNESISQNDVRNILRRGASEGYSEVEFIAVDGYRYRSTWFVRRARNSATGRLQNQSIEVYNVDKDEHLQGGKTEMLAQLQRLVGLSYDQFTRTVLLAQNDFATFLKSKENAKAELLEKLTGTGVYSQISKLIYEHYQAEKRKLEGLENQLSFINLLSPEDLEKAIKEHDELKVTSSNQLKEVEKLKKIDELFTQFDAVQKEISSVGKTQKELIATKETQEKNIEEKKKNIHSFEKKCIEVQEEIEQAISLDGQLEHLLKQVKDAKNKVDLSSKKTTECYTSIRSKEKAQKDLLLKLNTIYTKIALPSNVEKTLEGVTTYLEEQVSSYKKEISSVQNQLKLIDHNKLVEDQKELNSLRAKHALLVKAYSDFEHYQKDLKLIKHDLEELKAKIKAAKETITKKKEELSFEEKHLLRIEELYKKAQIQVSSNVTALRNRLKEGEECPVCGSTEHHVQYLKTQSQFDVLETEFNEKRKLVSDIKADINALIKGTTNDETALAKREKEELVTQNFIGELLKKNSQEELQAEFINNQSNYLNEKEKELLKQQNNLQILNTKNSKLVNAKDNLLVYLKDIENVNRLYHDEEVALGYLRKTYEEQLISNKQLETEYNDVNSKYENIQTSRKKLLKGKTVEDSKQAIDTHRKKLNNELELLIATSLKVINSIASNEGQLEQLNKTYALLKSKLQGNEKEDVKSSLKSLNEKITEIQSNLSNIELKLKQQQENEKQSKELIKSIKKQEKVYEQWAKLSSHFGSASGDKFKVIAQSYTLQILLLHANKHLSYLARRYRLEQVNGTLSLQVIDRDMCDEIRTVYSLSGGESFLISLALALGLSSLSSNNLKVESLFIDEGFGSLDSESLRTAMDALEQLQIQGRKIGVISHVQEMSERIPIQIHLSKQSSGKSLVTILE